MEINGLRTEKQQRKINKTESWLIKSTNGIDKFITGLTKKKREKMQITNVRHEKGNINANPAHIKWILRKYYH